MNKVFLIGNLTRDPELTKTANSISVCKMSIAVNRPHSKDQETDFFNVTAWRGLADTCGKFLSKGKKILVVGTLQNRTYEKDGEKKTYTDIVADEIDFLSPKSETRTENLKSIRDNAPIDDFDLPF